jgi:hypothetical protein
MNNEHPMIKNHARNVEVVRQWFSQFHMEQLDQEFKELGRPTNNPPKTRAYALLEEFEEDSEIEVTYDQFIEGAKLAHFRVEAKDDDSHFIHIVEHAKRWVMRGFRDPNA